MFNQTLLKSFLVASWILVIYAATPYSPDGTRWLAGVALALSYCLCGVVFGATDQEAVKVVKSLKAEVELDRENSIKQLINLSADVKTAIEKCEKATDRVSKAISELRSLG